MDDPLSANDIREFSSYLRQCTDQQVQGVYEKEMEAARLAYVELVMLEAGRRGIIIRV